VSAPSFTAPSFTAHAIRIIGNTEPIQYVLNIAILCILLCFYVPIATLFFFLILTVVRRNDKGCKRRNENDTPADYSICRHRFVEERYR